MLKRIELSGFKSFARKGVLEFAAPISAIVGPNGSGKSNTAEAFRFVLGEQSMKNMRSKKGEDLIWSGTQMTPRANKASVKVVFDNSHRMLDIDFDEVILERAVYRDGTNEYTINGSKVRLKDITALLAGANIGSSGHHIISQGEADKILNANPLERRDVLEDALGLKVYLYKKTESERKLKNTLKNIEKVESLQNEITPHLKFLERQMKKIEKAKDLREELVGKLSVYLARESSWIARERERVETAQHVPKTRMREVEEELAQVRRVQGGEVQNTGASREQEQIDEVSKKIYEIEQQKDTLSRELGRTEGQITFLERRIHDAQNKPNTENRRDKSVSLDSVNLFVSEVDRELVRGIDAQELPIKTAVLVRLREMIKDFVHKIDGQENEVLESVVDTDTQDKNELQQLQKTKSIAEEEIEKLSTRLYELIEQRRAFERAREDKRLQKSESDLKIMQLTGELNELRSRLVLVEKDTDMLTRVEEAFNEEVREGVVLVGVRVQEYQNKISEINPSDVLRNEQETERRGIERLKIKLEDMGGVGDDVISEFNETQERMQFLAKEITDLREAEQSLQGLIGELEEKIGGRFKEGLIKINVEFNKFFTMLFDGGVGSLHLVKPEKKKPQELIDEDGNIIEVVEDEDENLVQKEGVEVRVQLPRKKISTLDVLSGGERALTSIALIFAMSQVTPPPFIILDETDAALDEANSRKYADIIKTLSEKSQLILITHNRATMSVAGLLYGVTMGDDGVSKLLSVKFDEATSYAK